VAMVGPPHSTSGGEGVPVNCDVCMRMQLGKQVLRKTKNCRTDQNQTEIWTSITLQGQRNNDYVQQSVTKYQQGY
jgi:hypothetical protein